MKNFFRFSLVTLWVLLAAGFLARWWLTHPDAIPRFPTSFWIWLTDLYGAQNAEEVADVEMWVALSISIIVVSLFTLFGRLVWHHIKTALTHHSTRTR